ncbi:blastula protease 10-like [Patiria miniata]|uniref:Metalloendopeptidase n=1 Tax=Patiria miniata TaxID=46514 RepID=A0A914BAE8_PATMI|nr:blastula protease 10-like [Patiria miniata]
MAEDRPRPRPVLETGRPDGLEPPEEREDTEGAFQSDMLLSQEQRQELWELVAEAQTGVSKRRVDSVLSLRWPQNVLPYLLDSDVNIEAIRLGMNIWTEHTCVRFVPYSQKSALELGHNNRVLFYRGSGCSSFVGMVGVGLQQISIGVGCSNPGTVAHEIGHTLGWHHEQSRIDRDDYVTIHAENIYEDKKHNFVKYDILRLDNHDLPYDVRSIMHYGSNYFSSNGLPTIVAHNLRDHYLMGNREYFTFYDMKMANVMFNCSDGCLEPPECQHEGFVNQNCTCVCQAGFTGPLCETFDFQRLDLEHVDVLTERSGTMKSPGYPGPYENGITFVWEILGGEGATITISFSYFKVDISTVCLFDRLVIQEGNNVFNGSRELCGPNLPADVQSTGRHLMVIFKSYYYEEGAGFEADYVINGPLVAPSAETSVAPPTTHAPVDTAPNCDSVVGTCGGTFKDRAGCIASPNYGFAKYENFATCRYDIEVADGLRVELIFLEMDIEDHIRCSYDKLEISPERRKSVGSFLICGYEVPRGSLVSLTNKMSVVMSTDASVTGKGFAARFRAISVK